MKVKRILVVHNSYQIRGGEDIAFENEVMSLKKAGHMVTTYVRSNEEFSQMGKLGKMKIALESFFSIKSYRDINRIIEEKKIEIIHVHNSFFLVSSAVYFCAFKYKIPIVQTLHNFRMVCPNGLLMRQGKICEECMNKGLICALHYRCYRNSFFETLLVTMNLIFCRRLGILRKVNFICLTEFNREKLIKSNLFKRLRLKEEQFYVKTNFVTSVEKEERLDERMIFPFFVYCGRLSEEKGIITLLEAWKIYKHNRKEENIKDEYRLVILGDGSLRKECENASRILGDDSIVLKGLVDKATVNFYMKKAVATIVPSECYEGCSLSVREAFSNGCPVIGSDVGNVGLAISPGYNGYYFKMGNPESLAETILRLIKHDAMDLHKGALETYAKCYTEEKNLELLESIYTDICNRNSL